MQEFQDSFTTEDGCREYLFQLRWPEGFRCPRCGNRRAWAMQRRLFRCSECDLETSLTAGTVFQDTRKPLRLWFQAMWYVTNQKQGVNALGLQRLLGLGSYHTAWTWLHKLRRAMVRPGRDRLAGTVEVDETFLGGPQPGKRGRGAAGKVLVLVAASIRHYPPDTPHPVSAVDFVSSTRVSEPANALNPQGMANENVAPGPSFGVAQRRP